MPRRPTIIDVARAAGVSKSVVSRVITGQGPVSPATRTRVEQAMQALDYQLNSAARSLKKGSSGTVGVLLRNVTNDFYASHFARLQEQAARDDVRIIGTTGNMVPGSEAPALSTLLDLGVDALIVGSGLMSARTVGRIASRIPTVVISRPAAGTDASAVYDDPDGHAQVLGHLWQWGHRSAVLIDHDPNHYSARVRVDALHRAASQRGMKLRSLRGGYEVHDGARVGDAFLADRGDETAVVSLSFQSAIGVMERLAAAGVVVPRDITVVAADSYHLPLPFLPDVSGTCRDEVGFAAAVWTETIRRLNEPDSEPREMLVPVAWHEGATLAEVRGP